MKKCARLDCNNEVIIKNPSRPAKYCSQKCARKNFGAFVI